MAQNAQIHAGLFTVMFPLNVRAFEEKGGYLFAVSGTKSESAGLM